MTLEYIRWFALRQVSHGPYPMSGVFISYRRDDSAGHAGRLFDKLAARLGADQVFMDVDAIVPGQDFGKVIEERIARCDMMIVIIGREWLTCTDASGRRRLDDPEDFVRGEIAAALRRGLAILPVLVEGTTMPAAAQLPADLILLTARQAVTLTHARFDSDVQDLLDAAERYLVSPIAPAKSAIPGRRRHGIGALLFAIGVLAGVVWIQTSGSLQHPRKSVAPPDISGPWVAEVPIDGQRRYTLRLQLESIDGKLLGRVEFPAGNGSLREGHIAEDRVSFVTVHLPQFETTEVTTRFEGRLVNNELDLVMQYADVVKRVRLRRPS